jgi:tetratricopeptide (TPR) repeat protein
MTQAVNRPARRDRWHSNLFAASLLCALAACNEKPAAAPADPAQAELDATDPKKLLAQVDALAGPMKSAPKTFEVLSALGNLYYDNGRYLDAVDVLRQAIEKAAPLEAAVDALHAKQVVATEELPLECRRAPPKYGFEQIFDAAKKLEAADPAKALRCYTDLLATDLDNRARRGDALYLIGQPDAALKEHKKILAREPDAPESLFFVGAITLEESQGDKAKLEEGKGYWRRLLEVAPTHPRAALVKESLPKADELFAPKPRQGLPSAAPGTGELPQGHPTIDGAQLDGEPNAVANGQLPPAHPGLDGAPMPGSNTSPMAHSGPSPEQVANVEDAVAQTERTPELEQGLDALTTQAEGDLDAHLFQAARDKIVRVMPMRPSDARTAADMGAAMAGLGKTEMAERVLGRALAIDPKQPRALYELGKLLALKGDKAGAKEKLLAAKSADAKFAAAHHVDDELGKLSP